MKVFYLKNLEPYGENIEFKKHILLSYGSYR